MLALHSAQEVHDTIMGVYNPQKTGTTWISINAYPIFDGGTAQPTQVMTNFEDVSKKTADLWHKTEAELLGTSLWDLIPNGKQNEAYARIQQAKAMRVPVRFESRSQLADQYVEVFVSPTSEGVSGFFLDITERKRAE